MEVHWTQHMEPLALEGNVIFVNEGNWAPERSDSLAQDKETQTLILVLRRLLTLGFIHSRGHICSLLEYFSVNTLKLEATVCIHMEVYFSDHEKSARKMKVCS